MTWLLHATCAERKCILAGTQLPDYSSAKSPRALQPGRGTRDAAMLRYGYAMLCYTAPAHASLCNASLCHAVLCYAMSCHVFLCCAMLCPVLFRRGTRCFVLLWSALLYYLVLCCVVLCNACGHICTQRSTNTCVHSVCLDVCRSTPSLRQLLICCGRTLVTA